MARLPGSDETRRPGFRKGPSAASRHASALPAVAALMLGAALLSGCSTGGVGGGIGGVGGWFGASASRKDAATLYARRDNVEVREKADASSKAVATLKAGEKVRRVETSGTWAGIEARGGRVKGWVPASLLASKSAGTTPASPAGSTAAPSGGDNAAAENAGADSAAAESEETTAADNSATEASAAPAPAAPPPAAAPAQPARPSRPEKSSTVAPSVFDPY